MPQFSYTARVIASGESVDGELSATDERAVVAELRSKGLLLTSVKIVKQQTTVKWLDRFQRVPLKERMMFTRNLGVMVGSGLTVSKALMNLSEQTKNKYFQKILDEVRQQVESGNTFSGALAAYPAVFDQLFTSMVYVGEISGNLEKILEILAIQLEKEHELTSKVKGALMYPSVVMVAMIGIGIVMLTYVLPRITSVFRDMDVTLPASTLFIMGLGDFMQNHSFLVMGGFVGIVAGTKWFAGTPHGKRIFGWLALRTPIISDIIVKVNCARFARIFSSLLKSGVAVTNALMIVSDTISNVYYKDALKEGLEEIQKGVELSTVILRYPKAFPVLVPQMLAVGEETGKTEVVLERLADFYEEEVNQVTKNLSSILEPVLMVFIGTAVGFFAVAMLQPIYSVMDNIN
ncbi:MAG: type II secretion system F family protein [Candidatus Moraniibacteriota bacterium]